MLSLFIKELYIYLFPILISIFIILLIYRHFKRQTVDQKRIYDLLNNLPEAVIVTNKNGSIQKFYGATQTLLQYSLEEIKGKNIEVIIPELKIDDKNNSSETKITEETNCRRKDNTTFFSELIFYRQNISGKMKHIYLIRDICEERKAQKELESYQNNLKNIIDERTALLNESQSITHMGHWEWKFSTDEFIFSDEVFRIMGYKPQSFQANKESYLSCIHPDDRAYIEVFLIDAHRGMLTDKNFEYRIIHPNGSIRYVQAKLRIQYDKNNSATSLIGTILDITIQKKINEQLKESERLFHTIYDNAPVGIALIDKTGKVEKANERLLEFFGYSKEEFYQMRIPDFTHPSSIPESNRNFKQLINGEIDSYRIEKRYYHKDGKVIWGLLKAVALKDSHGNFSKDLAMVIDINELKESQVHLQEERDRARTYFDIARVILIVVDKDQKVTLINRRGKKLLGYDESEIMNKEWFSLAIPKKFREKYQQLFYEIMEGKKELIEYIEAPVLTKNGEERLIAWDNILIRNDNQEIVGMLGSGEDITERKEMENRLHESIEELKRSNSELEQFAYISSHDLQEPLRKIQSFSERLQAKYFDILDDRGKDYLNRISASSDRMRKLINDILDFSRITSKGKPFQEIDLNIVLKNVLDDLEVVISKNQATIQSDPLPTIRGDQSQIYQLFMNILSNSIKFKKEDASPKIKIKINNNFIKKQNYHTIIIEDNGIGFDPAYKEKIFKVFERLHGKDLYSGTGIGLATCKKIVERHGGSITAKSQPNKGAKFIIEIPVS